MILHTQIYTTRVYVNWLQRVTDADQSRGWSQFLASYRARTLLGNPRLSMRTAQAEMSADLHGRNPSAWLRFETEVVLFHGYCAHPIDKGHEHKGGRPKSKVRRITRSASGYSFFNAKFSLIGYLFAPLAVPVNTSSHRDNLSVTQCSKL
jgi:hypothetical protein